MKPSITPRIPGFRALITKYFLGGMLVVIPIGVTVFILLWALGTLWGLREWVPENARPEAWLSSPSLVFGVNTLVVGFLALFLAIGVSVIGWASQQLLGQKLLGFLAESVILRLPVLRSVYSALDQLLRTLAEGGGKQFNRVVYIEYPRKGVWTLAFVTSHARGPAIPAPDCLNVYVPTTPNPTSGFFLLVPESDVRESGLTVEQAFKTILSLGIAQEGLKK